MDFNEYQKAAHSTAVYPEELGVIYPALKLAGEAGEVAEKIGKMLRDGTLYLDELRGAHVENGMTVEQEDALKKELGDVLWYVAEIATVMGWTLDQVAAQNIDKLSLRSLRNILIGEGDNR